MKLLLVDADARPAQRLRQALAAHGHVVDTCPDGDEAGHLLLQARYALVLLRDGPPGPSAQHTLQALQRLQDRGGAQVLVVGAAGADERARVLRAGADDYLREPFELAEALARIQALCRRRGRWLSLDQHIAFADLEMDFVRRHAARQGRPLALTAQEFALLAVLARNLRTVLSRAELREHLWPHDFDSDSNVVDVAVRRLRAKLDRNFETPLLHTVRGAGYVLDDRRLLPD